MGIIPMYLWWETILQFTFSIFVFLISIKSLHEVPQCPRLYEIWETYDKLSFMNRNYPACDLLSSDELYIVNELQSNTMKNITESPT